MSDQEQQAAYHREPHEFSRCSATVRTRCAGTSIHGWRSGYPVRDVAYPWRLPWPLAPDRGEGCGDAVSAPPCSSPWRRRGFGPGPGSCWSAWAGRRAGLSSA